MINIFQRRTRLTFHHACGTLDGSAKPCSLQVQINHEGTVTHLLQLAEDRLFNNGTLATITNWPWEDIMLPILKPESKISLLAHYDTQMGGVNVDNLHFYTQQKCVARWSIMRNVVLVNNQARTRYLHSFPFDVETIRHYSHKAQGIDSLFKSYLLNAQSVKSVEKCSR